MCIRADRRHRNVVDDDAAGDRSVFEPIRLASLDQFHIGGLAATVELAKRAKVHKNLRVLDAGSGLGGPSRYLAETFGCNVEGIDLAPYYVALARMLTDRLGLGALVSRSVGNLTSLAFPEGHFDLVWTQHVVMNIRDRDALYRELRRVLKPGGTFAWYDVLRSEVAAPPYYPVPWADTAATSTLLTQGETVAALERTGFIVDRCDDVTVDARTWIAQQQEAPSPLGTAGIVVGKRMGEMVANFRRNIDDDRIKIFMSICHAA